MTQPPRAPVTQRSAFHASLSPPLWKDQLRQRCMARLRQDRRALLAKLRCGPDGAIAEEMKRLVYREERRGVGGTCGALRHPVFDLQRDTDEDDDADHTNHNHNGIHDAGLGPTASSSSSAEQADADLVTIDDLLHMGALSEADYLDIVHALEDALLAEAAAADDEDEVDAERLAEQMMEFEEASLAAMLASLDLDPNAVDDGRRDGLVDDLEGSYGAGGEDVGPYVLCPICKLDAVRVMADDHSPSRTILCSCGFTFAVRTVLHGVLEDFQEKIAAAFLGHRERCSVDPTFDKITDLDGEYEVTESLLMSCGACGHECLVR